MIGAGAVALPVVDTVTTCTEQAAVYRLAAGAGASDSAGSDSIEYPVTLIAATVTVYRTPVCRPVTASGDDDPVA